MDVVFVVMPFADVGRPAMGVSLLKAELTEAGVASCIEYFNIDFAATLEREFYQQIASSLPPDSLLGEWFFADDLFGDSIPPEDEYIEKVLLRVVGTSSSIPQKAKEARKLRARFLDDCARKVMAHSPAIVGFTSTFHQTCASLAVARRLKQLPHPPLIVFGGANCEGEMGLQMIQSFPWIDYICCGEADLSFVRLTAELLRNGAAGHIPGVLRQGHSTSVERSEAVQDMNRLPIPDFDEYFAKIETLPPDAKVDPNLIFETSRGCWWGAKHHCTFCGLNGDTMAFRSKSPERAFLEIQYLTGKYRTNRIGCVDNILDMRYIDGLFPRLSASGLDLNMFYEVKANLRYDQLVKLRGGGMRQIQPGIESFSNQVLRLMDKGCTGFQNIQLLRWCEELGIEAAWNLLAGFPGESPDEYQKMAQLIPFLTHLNPPCSCAQIRLDRFSPFHSRADSYGFQRLRPARAYYYVFPFGRKELARLAYFFDFDYGDGRQIDSYLRPVQREMKNWWDQRMAPADKRPVLDARFQNGDVVVTDTRAAARSSRHEFEGAAARVLAQCDVATTLPALLRSASNGAGEGAVREAVDELLAKGVLAESEGQYLSLAVFRDRPAALAPNHSHAYLTASQPSASEPLFRLV